MKNYNRTIKFGPGSQPEFYSKKTTSGLWNICVSKGLGKNSFYLNFTGFFSVGSDNFTCRPISYFPQEKYQPDDQDSTHAIPCKMMKTLIL